MHPWDIPVRGCMPIFLGTPWGCIPLGFPSTWRSISIHCGTPVYGDASPNNRVPQCMGVGWWVGLCRGMHPYMLGYSNTWRCIPLGYPGTWGSIPIYCGIPVYRHATPYIGYPGMNGWGCYSLWIHILGSVPIYGETREQERERERETKHKKTKRPLQPFYTQCTTILLETTNCSDKHQLHIDVERYFT